MIKMSVDPPGSGSNFTEQHNPGLPSNASSERPQGPADQSQKPNQDQLPKSSKSSKARLGSSYGGKKTAKTSTGSGPLIVGPIRIYCNLCEDPGEGFPSKSQLTHHENTVHKMAPHVCKKCQKMYRRIDHLNRHLKDSGHLEEHKIVKAAEEAALPAMGDAKATDVMTSLRKPSNAVPGTVLPIVAGFDKQQDNRKRCERLTRDGDLISPADGFPSSPINNSNTNNKNKRKRVSVPANTSTVTTAGTPSSLSDKTKSGQRLRCKFCDSILQTRYQLRQHEYEHMGIAPPPVVLAGMATNRNQEDDSSTTVVVNGLGNIGSKKTISAEPLKTKNKKKACRRTMDEPSAKRVKTCYTTACHDKLSFPGNQKPNGAISDVTVQRCEMEAHEFVEINNQSFPGCSSQNNNKNVSCKPRNNKRCSSGSAQCNNNNNSTNNKYARAQVAMATMMPDCSTMSTTDAIQAMQRRWYSCLTCDRFYSRRDSMAKHYRVKHQKMTLAMVDERSAKAVDPEASPRDNQAKLLDIVMSCKDTNQFLVNIDSDLNVDLTPLRPNDMLHKLVTTARGCCAVPMETESGPLSSETRLFGTLDLETVAACVADLVQIVVNISKLCQKGSGAKPVENNISNSGDTSTGHSTTTDAASIAAGDDSDDSFHHRRIDVQAIDRKPVASPVMGVSGEDVTTSNDDLEDTITTNDDDDDDDDDEEEDISAGNEDSSVSDDGAHVSRFNDEDHVVGTAPVYANTGTIESHGSDVVLCGAEKNKTDAETSAVYYENEDTGVSFDPARS